MSGAIVLSGVADAQTRTAAAPPSPAVEKGYVEGVAQSAFGNVTTQSYGVELGATVRHDLQVFAEFGRIKNVADTTFTGGAGAIANALAQLQPAAVGFSARRPVIFFAGGVKYRPPTTLKVQPYVLGGFGFATVKNDVAFTLAGSETSASALAQYVTFGSDLSGQSTKPLLTLGAGVTWPIWQALLLDFQYRFGRIFTDEQATTTNRAGIGFGVRF
jgi:opacity protein-like surface antigen